MHYFQRIIALLANPLWLFWLLPWVMMLLVIGTLAQKNIGLYQAEQYYFSSFIFWVGVVPLPGMWPALLLLTLALMAKLVCYSPMRLRTCGIVITHMGALLLLVGSAVTAFTSQSGSITLAEGENTAYMEDYHARELLIFKNNTLVMRIDKQDLQLQIPITNTSLPFTITPLELCDNCTIKADGTLNQQPIVKEDEANTYALRLAITHASDPTINGEYSAGEADAKPLIISYKHNTDDTPTLYRIAARKKLYPLPFSMHLQQFTKYSYPGTDTAREYESRVRVGSDDIHHDAVIRMNEPMRYKGYTIYQTSFLEHEGQQFSVFTVVKNSGRIFPYLSSVIMCIGLIIHLIVRRTHTSTTYTARELS